MNAQPIHHVPRSAREYAAEVLAEPSVERRRAMLEACPAIWRDIVRSHVEETYEKVKAYRAFISGRRQSMAAGPQPAPRREDSRFRISDFKKSAPEKGNQELAKLKALVGGRDGD
ncbi:hypothetical protein [Pseudomonas citronellolis]|uniref:hypothetical protein n=1 Tax=Pseudomonas citronellolis TaxID=53408 RepID=UPI000778CCB2|nr:hypothetical protein [Pseudomonas citronellolis]AMO73831.1 hypothetical protein PcP3B5_03190 [Pseudomonas citronellolis]